ncbi:hypothetical protein D3C84_1128970 [compost metagenome]
MALPSKAPPSPSAEPTSTAMNLAKKPAPKTMAELLTVTVKIANTSAATAQPMTVGLIGSPALPSSLMTSWLFSFCDSM